MLQRLLPVLALLAPLLLPAGCSSKSDGLVGGRPVGGTSERKLEFFADGKMTFGGSDKLVDWRIKWR